MHDIMKILIITTNPELVANKKLRHEFERNGHSITCILPSEIQNTRPQEYDLIFNRNTGLNYLDDDLTLLKNLGDTMLVNPVASALILRDKYKQWQHFKTILAPHEIIPTFKINDESVLHNKHQTKWIIKTIRGQQAKGIHTTFNIGQERQRILNTGDLNYIVQPYIELIREWRFLMIKGKDGLPLQFIICKQPKLKNEDFKILNFASSNAELVSEENCPQQALAIAHRISQQLAYHFISVDIIEDAHGNCFFLEANSCPGLKHADEIMAETGPFESITQALVAHLIR